MVPNAQRITYIKKLVRHGVKTSHLSVKKVNNVEFGPIKPFLANIPILYPLKAPENQSFSGVFKGV